MKIKIFLEEISFGELENAVLGSRSEEYEDEAEEDRAINFTPDSNADDIDSASNDDNDDQTELANIRSTEELVGDVLDSLKSPAKAKNMVAFIFLK